MKAELQIQQFSLLECTAPIPATTSELGTQNSELRTRNSELILLRLHVFLQQRHALGRGFGDYLGALGQLFG
jgi:hypothetical protein